MATKKNRDGKKPKADRGEPGVSGYVVEYFRWEDVLKAMPPARVPGAADKITNPLGED